MVEAPNYLPATGIPQIGAIVVAAGQGIATVSGEIHRIDLFGVPQKLQTTAASGIEPLGFAIFPTYQHITTVGRERDVPQPGFRKWVVALWLPVAQPPGCKGVWGGGDGMAVAFGKTGNEYQIIRRVGLLPAPALTVLFQIPDDDALAYAGDDGLLAITGEICGQQTRAGEGHLLVGLGALLATGEH